jgi:uncharacterized protein YfaS (alpha-2-macroglobulin family)
MTTAPTIRKNTTAIALLIVSSLAVSVVTAQRAAAPDRDRAAKLLKDGNWKEAYDQYSKLALAPATDPSKVGHDLTLAIQCLQNLGRSDEIDKFRESVIATHPKNWRLLQSAALTFLHGEHYGFVIGGEFNRGGHRGGGKMVSSLERDRVRSMQLMVRAMDAVANEPDKRAAGQFYLDFSDMVLHGVDGSQAFRLQDLTDLAQLPDYEENPHAMYGGRRYYRGYDPYGGYGGHGYGMSRGGAPVNEDGSPVFHTIPKTWADSKSDGQRWRWLLVQAMELDSNRKVEARFRFANFLKQQFGVQTMAGYGYGYGYGRPLFGRQADDAKENESGPYAVSTLKETETIAQFATGIKRFDLPDEFNYIKAFQQIADEHKGNELARQALNHLGQSFEDRQQYEAAATYWKRGFTEYPHDGHARNRFDQITRNWGMFEPIGTQPSGKEATFEFRFRNGKKVSFEAWELDYRGLLNDVKAYIKSNPRQIEWDRLQIDQIGYQLVQNKAQKYVGKQVATWDLALEPRPKHYDQRITVKSPLVKSGAYYVRAKMEDGNEAYVVLWLTDSVLVKKQIDGGSWYYLADAVTGHPVGSANIEFFGYEQRHVKDQQYQIHFDQFAENTDADGQVILKNRDPQHRKQWLITATDNTGRLATIGFSHIWGSRYPDYDHHYTQTRIFGITDRPVYRPGHTVKWKSWIAQSRYDHTGASPFAGHSFTVHIHNPKGDKILDKTLKLDNYGGCDGEMELPKDATLGVYQVHTYYSGNMHGSFNFRVEEYKKPEFEVKIDAPSEPVMLGEKITATINAKYYFGAPVTTAKVKFKILRNTHDARWFPTGRWDWMYGPGYWWFACEYPWYPGWYEWGCKRPYPMWWRQPAPPPEIVSEREVEIGADGQVKVEIDTALAKAVHGDLDHRYEIQAEVTDQSRRTITGSGAVLVARKPFKVYAWLDRGYYRTGDVAEASFTAQTLDNKPVQGKGDLRLLKISYDDQMKPTETEVQKWALDTSAQGQSRQQFNAAQPGQYRLAYKVTDSKNHTIEGGYVFTVRGQGFDGNGFRFNDIELITQKREYNDGDKVDLMINTNQSDAVVALFIRPAGVYLPPKIIRMKGKSTLETITVSKKDMPNFFVEAFVIHDGKHFEETKEIVVPPESRILNVEVVAKKKDYKPGEKTTLQLKLTDHTGEPFVGSTVLSVYDKSVEYISGGSNIPDIKSHFWKWRRHHHPHSELSINKSSQNLTRLGHIGMQNLGVFGGMVADLSAGKDGLIRARFQQPGQQAGGPPMPAAAPRSAMRGGGFGGGAGAVTEFAAEGDFQDEFKKESRDKQDAAERNEAQAPGQNPALVEPSIRKNFADTALWVAALQTNKNGVATVDLTLPEQLTTWKTRVWAMGAGTQVGEGSIDLVTTKDLIVRLQAPRFFVQKDQVVISANVHNYLKDKKTVKVVLDLDGGILQPAVRTGKSLLEQTVEIDPKGEKRVDWVIRATAPGQATIRVKAMTDVDSDAMEMSFPVYVHGMLKTESFAGAMKPDQVSAVLAYTIPNERDPAQSRLEIRYSPTLAMAMVDALPYLVEYPYGCTEQTLNRFVPTVITQKILQDMKLDLADIKTKLTNLNAQEIGDDQARATQWHRRGTAVFDPAEVQSMVKAGVEKLTAQQLSDGGWGWFSGYGEQSYPHTTAVVVHGLQVAQANGAAIVPGVTDRGVQWLANYQQRELTKLKNAPSQTHPYKISADNTDALVYMVLVDASRDDRDMRDFLFRDRNNLAVYAKAVLGLAMHKVNDVEKRDMYVRNVDQYLVQDPENQTAYLKMPEGNHWWYWWGSDVEAMGYYLKLLAAVDPKSDKASGLAKYLINNRKNATYWNSTRDTAVVIEALADYIRASGEDKPDFTLELFIDGSKKKEVAINASNLFTYDNKFVLTGDQVTPGQHKIEFRKKGNGPLYFNAYSTNFTMEDHITRAGLEVKVNRKVYKLTPLDKKITVSGQRGQAVKQKVEKYQRTLLNNHDSLKSGDLVEVEMEIESKNDYEYLLFEDMKAAGFEPVEVRSGYNGNDMHAYVEFRDERVCFFVRALARGKHSVNYRLRAEIPGKFSALPTKAQAMYAPELRANSDEIKLTITD